MLQTNIIRIFKKLCIIRSNIQSYWQSLMRFDPCQTCVRRQFSYGNSHTMGFKISQASDSFAICNDNDSNIRFWPIVEYIQNVSLIMNCYKGSLKIGEHYCNFSTSHQTSTFGVLNVTKIQIFALKIDKN